MLKLNYHQATFIQSAAQLHHLPPDTGTEIAIIGHSNAGKSSVLNQLTQNKSLARVSKTPGRTQLINLFRIDTSRRIVDLPGYGYAQVPHEVKLRWEKTLADYLQHRACLKGLILVMDIRHPLKKFDLSTLAWCLTRPLPVHVLLNKADKLKIGKIKETLIQVKQAPALQTPLNSLQVFSALKGTGINELKGLLDNWFEAKMDNHVYNL